LKKIKSIKLKDKYVNILKITGVILCIFLGIFIFFRKQINDLKKYGYSEKASYNILFSFKKDYILSKGENKTLNAAFESKDYNENNLDRYAKINYVKQDNLIKNINKLIKIGYSNDDIDLILTHGDATAVERFIKRDKVKYLDEFFSIDYAKLDNYDRYVAYSDETGENDDYVVLYVNLNLDEDAYTDSFKVKNFSYDMLINKHRYLDKKFKPKDLVKIDTKYTNDNEFYANKVAVNAFIDMANAASKDGLDLVINSAYRSFDDQLEIENTYRNLYGDDYVTKYVAKAGYSEHQTGLAFDIGSKSSRIFSNSKEYKWVLDNAYKYGFIHRFPKKYENITQISNEPWHFRYVGKKIAKKIYEEDMTLEEYFVKFLDK